MQEFDKAHVIEALASLSSMEKEFLYHLLEKKSLKLDDLIEVGKKTIIKNETDEEDSLDKIKELTDKLKELKLIKIGRKQFNPELSLEIIKPQNISTEMKKQILELRSFWKTFLEVKRLPRDYDSKIYFLISNFPEHQVKGAIYTACKRGKGDNPRYILGILKKLNKVVVQKKDKLKPKIKIHKDKKATGKQVKYIQYLLNTHETNWEDLGYSKDIEELNMDEAHLVIERLGGGDSINEKKHSKLFPDFS